MWHSAAKGDLRHQMYKRYGTNKTYDLGGTKKLINTKNVNTLEWSSYTNQCDDYEEVKIKSIKKEIMVSVQTYHVS